MVHLPYDSFATSVEAFVREGAKDRSVVGLKTTVYRTSDDSALLPALIEAAEEGKQTVCLVELKARFDERRNIAWSRSMERAGVHVVYGFANLKIHAKTTLIVRREGDSLRRYVHIGTGNYNASTARLYEDFGLFTSDEAITADIADLFNHLTGFGRPQRFRKILAAPFNLRSSLVEHIRAVARAAAARGAGAHPDQGQRAQRPGASSTSCTRHRRPAPRSTSSRVRSACCGRACPGCPRTSPCAAWSAGSSSTPACTTSRRATRRRTCSAAPT